MEIKLINPEQGVDLIAELDENQSQLYRPESCHLDTVETLQKENVKFCGAIEQGNIVAIGPVKLFEDYGELKRIYVPLSQRRKGLAKKMVTTLESIIRENNIFQVKLETGPYSKDAIQLYKNLGYSECGNFGAYKEDPLSTFMEKSL